ncbi:MAG TPA: cation:proton antiporter [Polyangia bacterium]|jgi:Kef-type K+ transport system membrane component KefB
MHADPAAHVVLALVVILVGATLFGDLAARLKQPPVLGELIFGMLLGNLGLIGFHAVDPLKTDVYIDLLARLGVLLLLFEVGLESTVGEMLKVGASSFLVAVLGVIAPFFLGWGVGAWLLPNHSIYMHAFLGATLTATSVGITARVLQDLGKSRTPEARVILGAAVIDDVLGLVVLAVVGGAIAAASEGTTVSAAHVCWVLGKAVIFLAAALVLGVLLSRRIFHLASRLKTRGVLISSGLAFCFLLSWIADRIGLAAIVGAFAAGLVLEEGHFRDFTERGESGLESLVKPISSFLAPVFFVLMGMRIDLASFASLKVLALAGALTVAAIIGKQACALGVLGSVRRWPVAIGMVPRGEVGLVFANIGLGLTLMGERIMDQGTFAAVLFMVIATTLVTPPALKWSLGRAHDS